MMKRIVLVLGLLSITTVSSAALTDTQNKGKEVINLKMGDMVLPFQHWKHQRNVNNECFHCHNTKIGKIDNWGKETAHKVCIACHELEEKGPVTCLECHPKPKAN
jgi:hypothetical protein